MLTPEQIEKNINWWDINFGIREICKHSPDIDQTKLKDYLRDLFVEGMKAGNRVTEEMYFV